MCHGFKSILSRDSKQRINAVRRYIDRSLTHCFEKIFALLKRGIAERATSIDYLTDTFNNFFITKRFRSLTPCITP